MQFSLAAPRSVERVNLPLQLCCLSLLPCIKSVVVWWRAQFYPGMHQIALKGSSMIYGLSVQCVSFIALPTIDTMQCISIKYYLRSTARSAVHWPQRCVTSLSILLLLPALVPCPAGSFRKFTSKIDNNHHDSCVIVSFIFHWVSSKSVPYTLKSSVAVHHLNSDCIFKCQPQNCCWLPPRSFFLGATKS